MAKIQAGQVSAALWENQVEIKGKTVTLLKTTIQRRYRDRDGNWQSSNSFGRNEIPLAIYCLQKVFDKIIEKQKEGSNGDVAEEISMMD
ncbi:MAG: hypothetical protein PHP01_04085 [Phycisphaerae bacterium]|nr:hypothetical protein [Phycisphaerae bacterium]